MEESPDSGQAGAPNGRVEITPEMIEVGVRALWEKTSLIEFPHPADRLGVKIILGAALRAQSEG